MLSYRGALSIQIYAAPFTPIASASSRNFPTIMTLILVHRHLGLIYQ